MADRYWVGGTANWDGTAGTKWATTSGGGGGASVPTTADDVFFTNLSTGTCTIATGNTGAKSINCTGFTGTIAGTAAITVAGSVTLVAGMTYTYTGTVTLTGTGTLTTAGKTFGGVTVDGVGITVTLGDAFTQTGGITVTRGTFNTANYNVTGPSLSSNNSNTRTITLGSSTCSFSASTPILFTNAINLTFNANTSQINATATSPTVNGGSLTFYNVSFTNTNLNNSQITGSNTFNNLTVAGRTSVGIANLVIAANQTINGTLTLSAGTNATMRTFVCSDTIGTTRTLTCNAVASLTDIDFRDITIAGSAAPVIGTRLGDCKGNSGITFDAPKTVYYRNATSSLWSAAWSFTNGGASDATAFPLAQDTAVFPSSPTPYPSSGNTTTINADYNIGTIDASARTTNTITFNINTSSPTIYGNWINGTGTTLSGTGTLTFAGRGSQTITSAGRTFTQPITIDSPSGTVQLGDAYNSSNTLTLTQGTFSAVTYNVTCTRFNSAFATVRTLNMGSGLWTLTGTGTGTSSVWNLGTNISNITFNKDTADILFSDTSTSAREFRGSSIGLSYNKLTIGGATGISTTTISGNGLSFTEIASTKTVAHTLSMGTINQIIGTWSVTGSSGNVVTVNSNSVGSRRTFTLTNVTSGIDYLAVQDIGVTDANRFYVGANSTNNGNNSNVIFTAAPAASNSNFFLMFA
jgi:hypothetical protein